MSISVQAIDNAGGSASTEHRYNPIDALTSFRVFHLQPGVGSEQLVCVIETVPWQDVSGSESVFYETISYVWGDPTEKVKLNCSEGWVLIPSNLESALQHLRLPDRTRVLWADSICINQADQEEKSLLVQRMDLVYSNASNVNMWLGPETDDVRGGLRSLHALMDLAVAQVDSPEVLLFREQARVASKPGGSHPLSILRQGNIDWYQLAALTRRPYFRRTWVIQEVVLARRAVMMCGLSTLDWEVIKEKMRWLWKRDAEIFPAIFYRIEDELHGHIDGPQSTKSFYHMLILSGFYELARGFTLYDLLESTKNFECTDPRDRLFATVNLLFRGQNGQLDPLIRPDYRKSEDQVSLDLARYITTKEGDIDYLARSHGIAERQVQSIRRPRKMSLLPTWVPDMNFAGERGELRRSGKKFFTAGATPKKTGSPAATHGGRVLRLRGKMAGQLEILTGTMGRNNKPDLSIMSTMAIVDADFIKHFRNCLNIVIDRSWRPENLRSPEVDRLLCALFRDLGGLLDEPREERLRLFWEHYDAYLLPLMLGESLHGTYMSNRPPDTSPVHHMFTFMVDTKFGRTTEGRFAVLPDNAHEGDLVCVIEGAKIPFLIRKNADGYWFVGEAYLEGVMYGEVWQDDRVPCRDIDLF